LGKLQDPLTTEQEDLDKGVEPFKVYRSDLIGHDTTLRPPKRVADRIKLMIAR
jgi:hypothetical protein